MLCSVRFINNYAIAPKLSKWQSFRTKNDYICTKQEYESYV